MVPAIPLIACFLGGATVKWSAGIVIALLGILLLADPPRFSLGRAVNVILLAILVCGATAFLPAGWFATPVWREVLTNSFGIVLPGTVSPQPYISLECLISFVAGLSWLYYVSVLDLGLRDVRWQLRIFATGVILLAGLCIALKYAHTALPFWNNERGFGPFPNRNQTANLFGLAGVVVLACGQDDVRHGRKRAIAWLIGLALIVAAVVLNFSRAGILLLVAGIGFWFVGFALCKKSIIGIALGLSAVLVLLASLLIFGGQTLERFHLRVGDIGSVTPDLRWAIYKDTLQLIRSSPWCGIGLGNFDELFALFRSASLPGSRTIHPESDWLWLWAETGWLTIPLVLAGMALLIWRVFPLQEGTNQRFRLAVLIAAILFALHGLIDVSGHRIGTVYSAMFFLGMALRRPAQLPRSAIAPWLFRGVGLLILFTGISWVFATRYQKALPGSVGVEVELHKATTASQGRDYKDAIQRSTRAIEWSPLKWQLYFARAIGKVGAGQPSADALADFQRARFLEPNLYEVPYQEGIVWLNREPALTLAAWQEALRRVGPQRLEIYGHMLALASPRSSVLGQGLEKIGVASSDLALVYLQGASGTDFKTALQDILESDPNLESFSGEEKTKLFALWEERGDSEALFHAAQAHPDWMKDAWRSVARYHARRKNYRSAFEIVSGFQKAPRMPEPAAELTIDQLEQAFHASPDNFGIGYQLYYAQLGDGRIDDALMTVRHFTEISGSPSYFHYLEAQTWAAKENWERAWNAWTAFEADRPKNGSE